MTARFIAPPNTPLDGESLRFYVKVDAAEVLAPDFRRFADHACQMQREESGLMIDRVCGRLMDEHPDCPLVTIHDSILTTPEWVETVRRTIMEEFARLGITPSLHVEGGLPVTDGERCSEATAAPERVVGSPACHPAADKSNAPANRVC